MGSAWLYWVWDMDFFALVLFLMLHNIALHEERYIFILFYHMFQLINLTESCLIKLI